MKIEIAIPAPIEKILQILHDAGGKPRIVGGSVRDALFLGPENSTNATTHTDTTDIDVITPLAPDIVTEILTKHDIIVKDTGIKYGTVTAFSGNHHAQITTLRVDKECDGRHVNAEFTDDFELDAKRRDFTINAMSYCPFEHKLYDYMDGYDDLMARRVVFIGDPSQRIEEDYLRILRFFRFADKFAGSIDVPSLEACIKLKHGMKRLSKERILMEMTKIMESATCHKVLNIMIENEILKEVMPIELTTDLIVDINENIPEILQANMFVKFAALMHKNKSAILKNTLSEMKFSTKAIYNIISLVKFREENPNIYELPLTKMKNVFLHLWVDNMHIDSYMLISEGWKSEHFERLHPMLHSPPPIFPIDGNDLIGKGIIGKAVKIELQRLKNKWIDSEFSLDREMLLKDIISIPEINASISNLS